MTRVSARTDRQQSRSRTPVALVWMFFLVAIVFCCSATASAAASSAAAPLAADTAPVRAMTPTPDHTAFDPVVAAAPADRGLGTSCHGGSTHTAAIMLPMPSAPLAVPSPVAVVPVAPLTGAAAIRGPGHDGVHSVDQLRLQVQRI